MAARIELLDAAARYSSAFGESIPATADPEQFWIVTGHQPELYHPGVWIKNFSVDSLARELNGCGISIITDNDAVQNTQVAVPTGSPSAPLIELVPFDRMGEESAYEERRIVDPKVFHGFGDRVVEAMRRYPFKPLVGSLWKAVVNGARKTEYLGECLSAGRRSLERAWGCRNIEIPLSRCCGGKCFGQFAAECLFRAGALLSVYNETLAEYRRLNRVRSRHHPAPALERDGDWLESPFWVWSQAAPVRRRLFVRGNGSSVDLRAEPNGVPVCSVRCADAKELAQRLMHAVDPWKIRPRAIMTTMYLRLAIADFFVHGVGGAKYDEMTDVMLARFFNVEPPLFAILSATFLLPIVSEKSHAARVTELQRLRRDLMWNPEKHLPEPLCDLDPIATWIERKIELREASDGTRAERTARFHEFRRLNERLRPYLDTKAAETQGIWIETTERSEAQKLLRSREFAYCLHPADSLRTVFAKV